LVGLQRWSLRLDVLCSTADSAICVCSGKLRILVLGIAGVLDA
jgi:hypothetical protein